MALINSVELTLMSSTAKTGYSPLFELMFNDAVQFLSVVFVYVTPFIVMSTVLFVAAWPLASVKVTVNFCGYL